MVSLAIASVTFYFWLTRSPSTQLVDASGRELTAGSVLNADDAFLGGAVFGEARALIKKKDFASAQALLLHIVEESDRDGEACILLSEVTRELKDVASAADYGLKAVELLPERAEAHLAYAKALGAQLAADMQSVSGMLSAVKQLGPFKTALGRVIELDPADTEARTMLVFSNLAPGPLGDMDRAIALSEEIEALDPVKGKQLLAMCRHRNKETDRAIALLEAGIVERPEEPSLHAALADILAEEKRFEAADAAYEAARRGDKGATYYRALYGQARMRILNKFEPARAVELLDEYIADEPDFDTMQTVAHACWRKGNALAQLGRTEDARAAYEESLRRDPDLELAKKSLAELLKP